MRNGMLSIYKEAGYTSNDVVAKLRGILHMRRIGHTGTLDPMAEGVLPVCLGNATRLCDMIADRDKEYSPFSSDGRQDPGGGGILYRGLQPDPAHVFRPEGKRAEAL